MVCHCPPERPIWAFSDLSLLPAEQVYLLEPSKTIKNHSFTERMDGLLKMQLPNKNFFLFLYSLIFRLVCFFYMSRFLCLQMLKPSIKTKVEKKMCELGGSVITSWVIIPIPCGGLCHSNLNIQYVGPFGAFADNNDFLGRTVWARNTNKTS